MIIDVEAYNGTIRCIDVIQCIQSCKFSSSLGSLKDQEDIRSTKDTK